MFHVTDTIMTQTEVIDQRLREEEVRRRLPEVNLIEDGDLREDVVDAIRRGFPDYFWDVPATSSGKYHHPYARDKHGLWIHVKMAFTAFERKRESYVKRDVLTEFEADCVRSALLLHDMLKYGLQHEEGDPTADNHDLLAGQWLRRNADLPDSVIRGVECHNGPWYEGPTPEYGAEPVADIVHMCDMDASTANITCGLYEPAEEIVSKYPDIPRAIIW